MRAGRSAVVGIPKGSPEATIRPLAREIRWAIVASGTRNAFATSAVVSPPTARRVNAIAEAGVSAGWQHRKRTIKVSSSSYASVETSSSATRVSRCRRDWSLRRRSISRSPAVRSSQPRGSGGIPSRGQ